MRRHLTGIYQEGSLQINRERLTVLICQHVSLFDGFAVRHMVQETGTQDRVVTIMLDSQLKRYPSSQAGRCGRYYSRIYPRCSELEVNDSK